MTRRVGGADGNCSKLELEPGLLPSVQRLFSALLFADRTLRAPAPWSSRSALPCKRKLWG